MANSKTEETMVIAVAEQVGFERKAPFSMGLKSRRKGGGSKEPSKALVDALTIIVHDLRGPLANLQVMLELIETYSERRAMAELPGCARRAQDIISTLDRLLGGFLERARLTGDPLAFRPKLIDLNDVVEEALGLSRPLVEARRIHVDVRCPGPVSLEGDRQLLLEAVDNILSNAIKYSPEGSAIDLVCGLDGGKAVISIADRGPGFSAAEEASLFRPFARLSKREPAAGPSTGLGLWIARLIATRHGGGLTVASRSDGPGSVFMLHLPRWR